MPFPQGGDFVRDVSRGFNVVSSDPNVDQGEGTLLSSSNPERQSFVVGFGGQLSYDYTLFQFITSISGIFRTYNFDTTVIGNSILSQILPVIQGSCFVWSDLSTVSSFLRLAQFNPGVLPHLFGVFSDLFVYDVYSGFITYNRLVIHMLEKLAARIKHDGKISIGGNVVQTDYYTTISGSDDLCVGDGEPPYITYIEPTASGIHLRPRNQIIEFSLGDAVAGVDLSTVYISLNSTTSGTISLVEAGVDQTGGSVSIVGDSASYLIRYTPPFLWDYNDTVVVTISGSDLPSVVDGNPFFCGPAETNHFVGDIPFQVLNEVDFNTSLNVIGDDQPPYIYQAIPASGTSDNNVFDPVVISIADDITGVDLSTISVVIDGKIIVNNGIPATEETVVTGHKKTYTVTYTPNVAFTYGSTSTVTVSASDLVAISTPNQLLSEYNFSFISDSTVVIDNIVPAVGTHVNIDDLDISVDVTDNTYGIDSDQTFLVINGTVVSGTRQVLASGIRMTYHPPNNYEFDRPIRVTVHGTNANVGAPAVKESFFTLFYGNRIFYFNDRPFDHLQTVDVFVRARNIENFYKDLATGYFFSTYTQPSNDFGASIVAVNPTANISAGITGLTPEHRYGKTVVVEFSVEDVNGNLLGPYTFSYTIEDKPD